MGWDGNVLTYPFTKIATNGNGDFQRMVGSSATEQIALFKNGSWNKWARYKFVKDTSVTRMTAALRKTHDQGFVNIRYGNATDCFNRARAAAIDWQYDRPTSGMTASQVAAYYPLRTWDFLNDSSPMDSSIGGYVSVSPCAFTLGPVGVYPNSSTAAGTVDFACNWYYRNAPIVLSDLQSFDGLSNTHDWYWCLLAKIPGTNNAVTRIPLMTTLHGSTKLKVSETPPAYPGAHTAYFTLTVGANNSGMCEAYFAVYAVNKTTADESYFIYLPVGMAASFNIPNASDQIAFGWTSINDTRQPSPAKYGIVLNYQTSGSLVQVTSGAFRLLLVPRSDYWPKSSAMTATVTIEVQGSTAGSSGSLTQTYTIPASAPSSPYFYKDFTFSTPSIYSSTVGATKIAISVNFNGTTWYLNPATFVHSNSIVWATIDQIAAGGYGGNEWMQLNKIA